MRKKERGAWERSVSLPAWGWVGFHVDIGPLNSAIEQSREKDVLANAPPSISIKTLNIIKSAQTTQDKDAHSNFEGDSPGKTATQGRERYQGG